MIIYAVKIQDPEISSLLNFVKLLCAPNSKTEVHLSIRGPYKTKIKANKFIEYNRIIKDSEINITEVGNFFSDKQNTVFLKCESDIIGKVWKKTTYGYNPHLTLYDGKDSSFATSLYNTIINRPINVSFKASELFVYDTSKNNPSLILTLGINIEIIEKLIDESWDKLDLLNMNAESRLKLVDKCFKSLEQIKN